VFRSRTFGTIGAPTTTAADPHLVYDLSYDSAGRPVTVTGTLRGASPTEMYRAYSTDAVAAGKWGAFDALGRPALIKADGGLAVSARIYDRYSGTLVMECKRVGDLACENLVPTNGASGAPGPLASRDLYRADSARASYVGTLLGSYTDNGTGTSYGVTYLPSGKVDKATATRSGTLAGSQSYEEGYTYDGLGNVKTAAVKKDLAGSTWATNQTQTYTPASATGGTLLDQVRSIGTTKAAGSYPAASEVEYGYDAMNRLRTVKRGSAVETLYYGPSGELMAKQAGTSWTFWVGEYATVTATIPGGCTPGPCAATSIAVDAHVIFAGTRIASAGTPAGTTAARTLYYYRSRLGSVVATSLRGGALGTIYRYTPYGAVAYTAASETAATRSELGYTNALRLSGSLLHLKTRVYDPETRIFLQVDSVDRQRYAYVRGDPANYTDPTGMMQIHDRQEKWGSFTLSGEYDWGALPNIQYGQTVLWQGVKSWFEKPQLGNGLSDEVQWIPAIGVDGRTDETGRDLYSNYDERNGLPKNRSSGEYASRDEAAYWAGRAAQPLSEKMGREFSGQILANERPNADGTTTTTYSYSVFTVGPKVSRLFGGSSPYRSAGPGALVRLGVAVEGQVHTHPSSSSFRPETPSREDHDFPNTYGVPLYVSTPAGYRGNFIKRLAPGASYVGGFPPGWGDYSAAIPQQPTWNAAGVKP